MWIFFLVSLLLGESVVKGHPCYRLSVIKNNKKSTMFRIYFGVLWNPSCFRRSLLHDYGKDKRTYLITKWKLNGKKKAGTKNRDTFQVIQCFHLSFLSNSLHFLIRSNWHVAGNFDSPVDMPKLRFENWKRTAIFKLANLGLNDMSLDCQIQFRKINLKDSTDHREELNLCGVWQPKRIQSESTCYWGNFDSPVGMTKLRFENWKRTALC